jgi:hypothetical protein
MSTTLGTIEYGTDVTISVEHLNCYSLSLPVVGEQELVLDGHCLRSDRDNGLMLSPDDSQELTIGGDCRKVQVAITRTAMGQPGY